MLTRYTDHGTALRAAKSLAHEHGCRVRVLSMYGNGSLTFVALPSSLHLLPQVCGDYHPAFGWHFGGRGISDSDPRAVALLATPDRPALPGKQESMYETVAGSTQGYTPERLQRITAAVLANGTCVWHECARESGRLATCECAPCVRAREERRRGGAA